MAKIISKPYDPRDHLQDAREREEAEGAKKKREAEERLYVRELQNSEAFKWFLKDVVMQVTKPMDDTAQCRADDYLNAGLRRAGLKILKALRERGAEQMVDAILGELL